MPSYANPWKVNSEISIPLFSARYLTIRSVLSSAPRPIRNSRSGLRESRLWPSVFSPYHSSKSSMFSIPLTPELAAMCWAKATSLLVSRSEA